MPQYEDSGAVKIGLCQTATVEWDVEDNFRRVIADIETAARQGAELIITPECVLNGYAGPGCCDDWKTRFPAATSHRDGAHLVEIRAMAARLGVEIIFSFAERDETEKFYNTAAYIGRDGDLVYAYRKTHCRPFESAAHEGLFTPGDELFVSERQYAAGQFRIGTMICFDREIVEPARCLRAMGAHLIACPLATNTYRLDAAHPAGVRADNEVITRARAAENEVFIAVVNHAGRFNGGSYIVGPVGETLIQLGAEPQVAVIAVPLGIVTERFHAEPLGWMGYGFRRPDLYRRYLGDAGKKNP
jgi:predicted amidohydrolase